MWLLSVLLVMAFVLLHRSNSYLINKSIGVPFRRLARVSRTKSVKPFLYSGSLSGRTKNYEDPNDLSKLMYLSMVTFVMISSVDVENLQRTIPLNVDLIKDQMQVIMKILSVEDFTVRRQSCEGVILLCRS